jgi:hypothetical protein
MSDFKHHSPEEAREGNLPLDPRSESADELERPDHAIVDIEDDIDEGNPNPPGSDV